MEMVIGSIKTLPPGKMIGIESNGKKFFSSIWMENIMQ